MAEREGVVPVGIPSTHDPLASELHHEFSPKTITESIPPPLRAFALHANTPSNDNTVYDPFTGEVRGTLVPLPDDEESDEDSELGAHGEHDTIPNLWAHLAKMRELQAEISRLHMQMEGVASATTHGHGRPRRNTKASGKAGESYATGPGEDDAGSMGSGGPDAQRFRGRIKGKEEEIATIMAKVNGLYHACFGNCESMTDFSPSS
jgi:hypothetical protein